MSKPPVILQILPEMHNGGVERGTVDIAKAIVDASGVALVVSAGGKLTDAIQAAGAVHITLPVASKNPWRIHQNIQPLREIIRQHGVNIVHGRSRAPAWSAFHAAKAENVPFITTFHGVYNEKGIGKHRYNSIMAKGQRVIAVSHYVQQYIKEHYAQEVHEDHIRVIHRGLDAQQFHPEAVVKQKVIQLIQDWHLEDVHVPILFMPARMTRWKGQHIALEAMSLLPHRQFICLFSGDPDKHPDYYRELHALVNRLKLERNVRFVPSTTHMTEAYGMSDIILAPSIEPEAFGRVVVEAQSMGKPVIASAHGGAMETVEHRRTGWLVPPNDALALKNAMEEVLSLSQYDKDAHSRYARQHVETHFSLSAMQNKTLDVYEEVMREGVKPTIT